MRILALVFLFILMFSDADAQQDTTKATVTFAAIYNSNINYYGQVTAEKYPYVLANATLRLPVGLYFSAGAYRLLNYGTGLSETDLGIGYDYNLNKKLSVDLSYTHSFFPDNSPLLQASNANNINISLAREWNWFKTLLSTDYAFGKQNDFFVSLNNAKEIELGTLLSEKNSFSIAPSFEITAGTTNFYETYIIEKSKKNNVAGNGKSGTAPGIINSKTTSGTEILTKKFKLLAYNFRLPLTFSRGNYLAELSYQFSVLGNRNEEEVKHQQSFFGVSMYYQL
jgi:hypothetical protein